MHFGVPELISFSLGIYFIVSRNWVAGSAAEFDYRAFGVRMDPKLYEIAFLIGGLTFVLLGLLSTSGLIHLQPLE